MGITEVVRGSDLLLSTARQLLLYRSLDWTAPAWAHAPLIMDTHGRRLAKRSAGLSLRELRARGCRPAEVLGAPLESLVALPTPAATRRNIPRKCLPDGRGLGAQGRQPERVGSVARD
jgi:hypothetical protein